MAAPQQLRSLAVADNTRPEHPLLLHSDEPLVAATPFLQWQPYPSAAPNGPPRVGVPHSRAAKVFLRLCSLEASDASAAGFAQTDCFTFFLSGGAWNRILNLLLQSNLLLGGPFVEWPAFLTRLEALPIADRGPLQIAYTDVDVGESFDTPEVPAQPEVAAVAARRGLQARAAVPAVAAQPAVPGPAALTYLSMVTVDTMLSPSLARPLEDWCDLLGALGAGRTRASRLVRLATVNTSGLMLYSAVVAKLLGPGAGQAADPLVAVNLPDLFREIKLPRCLLPLELGESDVRAELRDGIRAVRSDLDRHAVEVARIHYTQFR